MSNLFEAGTSLLYKQKGKKGVGTTWIEAEVTDVMTTKTRTKKHVYGIRCTSPSSSKILPRVSHEDLECMVLAKQYIDQPVAKDFGVELGGVFNGVVVDVVRGTSDSGDALILFEVVYSDGDGEDLEQQELNDAILFHLTHSAAAVAAARLETTGLPSEDNTDNGDVRNDNVAVGNDDAGSNSSSDGKENQHPKRQRTSTSPKSPRSREPSKKRCRRARQAVPRNLLGGIGA
eukprot:scaffold8090_cov82-Cylindrotheca_fusiformis.AAC.2